VSAIGLPRRRQSRAPVWTGPPLRSSGSPGQRGSRPASEDGESGRPAVHNVHTVPAGHAVSPWTPCFARVSEYGESALWPAMRRRATSPRQQCCATRTAALCPSGGSLRLWLHIFRFRLRPSVASLRPCFRCAPDVEPRAADDRSCSCPGAIPLGPASWRLQSLPGARAPGRPLRVRPAPCQRENRALPTNPTPSRESPAAAALRGYHTPAPRCLRTDLPRPAGSFS